MSAWPSHPDCRAGRGNQLTCTVECSAKVDEPQCARPIPSVSRTVSNEAGRRLRARTSKACRRSHRTSGPEATSWHLRASRRIRTSALRSHGSVAVGTRTGCPPLHPFLWTAGDRARGAGRFLPLPEPRFQPRRTWQRPRSSGQQVRIAFPRGNQDLLKTLDRS